MNPLRIELTNVRTYPQVALDIPEGLIAILGTNGAGKSTLISAIDVALFGPEGRSLAPWYPRGGGTDPMTVTLYFDHGNQTYRIRRSYSPKGRGQSKLDFEMMNGATDGKTAIWGSLADQPWSPLSLESQTATQERIENLIGLSRATFRASSYLAQGDSGAFCDALPGARKAILAEVIGLADWDRWLERARKEKRTCELEINDCRLILDRADLELLQRAAIIDERRDAEQQEELSRAAHATVLAGLTTARDSLTEALGAAERRLNCERAQRLAQEAFDDLTRRIQTREDELAGLDSRLAEREALTAAAARLKDLEAARDKVQASLERWKERLRLQAAHAELAARIEVADARVGALILQSATILERIGEEHCDRCGQILGEAAAQRAADSLLEESNAKAGEAMELRARAVALLAEIAAIPADEPDETVLSSLYDDIRLAQQAHTRLATLEEASDRREVAAFELGEWRAELPTRDRVLRDAFAETEALGPHDATLVTTARQEVADMELVEAELRAKIEATVRQLSRCDERLQRLATIEDEAVAQRARVESLLVSLDLLLAMERACSPNGIPALILESIAIPQVEVEASRLLRTLGGPATAVELRTLRELKSAGGIAETLDVVLMTETGEAMYETFSGGEKARIAFALRLALAQLLSARKGSDTGLLVIDEIDGLDADGVERLVGVLEALPASVPRIIVVSHQAELRDAFSQSLAIENVDGVSRIVPSLELAPGLEV